MSTLIISVLAGVILLLVAGVVLYLYPGIMIMSAEKESHTPQTLVQEDTRAGNNSYPQVKITVNDQILIADISATHEQRTRGLSVKDSLAESEAMLFVFDVEAEHRFWMKDMTFPIDIIWISSGKIVVDVEHNLPPCDLGVLCSIYEPEGDSLYVLETAAGFAEKYRVVKGTPVMFDVNFQNIS